MPGRQVAGEYRYGFNGQEKVDEVKGDGNSYDFGARMYDPRVGIFQSLDPKISSFPYQSPYLFAGNNPIQYVDINGEFKIDPNLAKQYPAFAKYLEENITEILKSDAIMNALMKHGRFDRATIEHDLQFGEGPRIDIRPLGVKDRVTFGHYDGLKNGEYQIALDAEMLTRFENAFKKESISDEVKQASLLGVVSTLLHEYTHHGTGGKQFEKPGVDSGEQVEIEVYGENLEPDNIRQLEQVLILKTTGNLTERDNRAKIIQTNIESIDPSVIPTLPKN